MDPNANDFQEKFQESLGNEVVEIGKSLSEVTLSSLVTSGPVLHAIPVVAIVASAIKLGPAVRDYHFAKKLIRFLNQVNGGNFDRAKLNEEKRRWIENPKERAKTVETLASIVDRLFDEKKAAVLAGIFVAYINGSISWNEFLHISFALEQLNPAAYEGLKEIWETPGHARSYYQQRRSMPLKISLLLGSSFIDYENSTFRLNDLGLKLWKHGFEDNPGLSSIT